MYCSDILLADHPLLKAGRIIFMMLFHTSDYFFRFQIPDKIGGPDCYWNAGIKVVNWVVDVSRKTPAIDLYFSFLDTLDKQSAAVLLL